MSLKLVVMKWSPVRNIGRLFRRGLSPRPEIHPDPDDRVFLCAFPGKNLKKNLNFFFCLQNENKLKKDFFSSLSDPWGEKHKIRLRLKFMRKMDFF